MAIKNFDKELNKLRDEFSTLAEKLAFLDGVEFGISLESGK